MLKKFFIALCCFAILTPIIRAAPPVANFSADITKGEARLRVQFTDLSTNNPTSWRWEFGDGDTKAVQVGGAAGFCVPRKKFNETIIGFEGVPTGGSMKVFNSSRSMYNVLHNYLEFFEEESCGQCTPCRVGCQQLIKGVEAVKKGEKKALYLDQLLKLSETMKQASKCGLGQSVANSFSSIVENFREEMIY